MPKFPKDVSVTLYVRPRRCQSPPMMKSLIVAVIAAGNSDILGTSRGAKATFDDR